MTTTSTERLWALRIGPLTIAVRILAERQSFGRRDVQITPVAGTGTQWIDARRLTPREED